MKKLTLFAAFALGTLVTMAQQTLSNVVKFESETVNFGKLKQGVPATGTFTFTNVGKTPLIIEQANPTCGCTMSDYTKEPIAPGKSGYIKATYNSAAMGHFDKHLTVKFAGFDEIKSITLTGDVLAADEYDKANKPAVKPASKPAAKPAAKAAKKA